MTQSIGSVGSPALSDYDYDPGPTTESVQSGLDHLASCIASLRSYYRRRA